MAKEESEFVVSATVVELLPSTTFRVQLTETGQKINAYLSGSMRRNRIRIAIGDRVEVEMSTYDLTRGRISRRLS